jgi:peptide/nickel transport system substrate-binding protein
VFSWRLYSVPDFGQTSSTPINSIEEVTATDPQTILIRWKLPFPLAGTLGSGAGSDFPPIPQHILGAVFEQLKSGAIAPDALAGQPYWTTEFVGAGPYKLARWDPGIELDGLAFDAHVRGRPKIDRVKVGFSTDQNASLARMLAGEVDYASDAAIGGQQAITLKQSWGPNGGSILVKLDYFRSAVAQLRAEQAIPAAIMDVRVRQALANSLDKQALRDGLDDLFQQGYVLADGPYIPPDSPYYAQIDRAITKYPYDPQRAAQLLSDAGLTRGGDGFYQSAAEGHLKWDIKTSGSVDNEREISILASVWRQAGFDFQQSTLPAALAQDGQARSTFPTFYTMGTTVGERMLSGMNTPNIPRPENRFAGSNRGGWSNPEFDRLSETLGKTIEPDQRVQIIAQLTALFSRDVVAIPLYFYGNPVAATSAVVGAAPVPQPTTFEWNVQEWTLAR